MESTLEFDELKPPERILMGPGPSNIPYRVYRALTTPILSHLDHEFMKIMDEVCAMLRIVFKTANKLTIPISGTGSAGMETSFVNILDVGDKAVIGINGAFGERMADVASRCGANVIRIDGEWGDIIDPNRIIDTLKKTPRCKGVCYSPC